MIRVATLVAASLAIRSLCLAPYVANLVMHRVDFRSHAAVAAPDPQYATVLARTSIEDLRRIERAEKTNVTYHMLFAANLRIINDEAGALAEYTAALAVDHRPELYVERGLTLFELGRQTDAMRDFARAMLFDRKILATLDPAIQEQAFAEMKREQRVP